MILIVTIMLGILLAIVVVFSILFFYVRLRDTRSLLSKSEYSTYDKYYVMITENRENDFWKSVYNGALREAAANGAYVELMGTDLDNSYSKEDLIRTVSKTAALSRKRGCFSIPVFASIKTA